MVENRDDSSGKDRLGLLDVRTWIAEITKHVPASLDQLQFLIAHSPFPFHLASRALSISAFGVLIPDVDFFLNAWTTHNVPAISVTYTTRQASVRNRKAISKRPVPGRSAMSALPPSAAIVRLCSRDPAGRKGFPCEARSIQMSRYVVKDDYTFQPSPIECATAA